MPMICPKSQETSIWASVVTLRRQNHPNSSLVFSHLLTDASFIMDSTTRKNTDLSAILAQKDLSCAADELRGIERSIAALAACLGVATTVFAPFSKSLVSNVPDASRCAALLKALTGRVAGKAKPTGEEKLVVKLLFENLGLHLAAEGIAQCKATGKRLLVTLVHDLKSKKTAEDAANQAAEAIAQAKMRIAEAANQVAAAHARVEAANARVEAANARVKELWAKNRTLEARKLELEAKGNETSIVLLTGTSLVVLMSFVVSSAPLLRWPLALALPKRRCAALLKALTGQVAGKAKPTGEEKLVVKLLFENLGLHSTAKWTCNVTGQLLLDVLVHDLQSKQTVEDAANQVAEANAQVAKATNQVEAANARVKELWAKNRTLEARKLELEAKGNANPATFPLYGVNLTPDVDKWLLTRPELQEKIVNAGDRVLVTAPPIHALPQNLELCY
ncbi:hypothetical protein CAOG_009359 [Capsaspora owczarzaki ATCC 30864]|uniref:Uncharacterized protein n=1 Tax=Capsaspora owczarzaki (strain ATCC 30864) TaxID=595528 RepID=A0A0D2X0P6_CAPO3|nr:hypothetical protein CAOG_009359 [Capsaspora owczarzaki ATCC 30864]